MKCPHCEKETDKLHDTAIGLMCRDCVFTAAAAGPGEFVPKPVNQQMQMFNAIAPHFNHQFLSETKGAVGVDYSEVGCKKNPRRSMWVGYRDGKTTGVVMHAEFSCS